MECRCKQEDEPEEERVGFGAHISLALGIDRMGKQAVLCT